ncbi:hypothetical protein LSAT2_014882 [Lamellibrachia satsuma]|nr:hypothetical protein LSAT2_014882 [Lamellibrachia satsuma]
MAYWNFGFVMDGGGDTENVADTSAVKDASLSASMLESWKQHEPGYIQSAKEQVPSMSNKVPYQPLDGTRLVSIICPHHPSLLAQLGPGVNLSLCNITADQAPLPRCPKYIPLVQGEYIPGLYTHVEVPVGVDLRFHYCIRRDSDGEILAIDSLAAAGRTHHVVPDREVYYNRPHLELFHREPTVLDSHLHGTVNESYVSDDSQQPLTRVSAASPAPRPSPQPMTSPNESPRNPLSRQTSRSKLNRFASAVGRAFKCIPSE